MDQGIQVGHEQQSQQQSSNIGKLNDKSNIRTVQPPRRDHDRYVLPCNFYLRINSFCAYIVKR